jgi:hypothetical protein
VVVRIEVEEIDTPVGIRDRALRVVTNASV